MIETQLETLPLVVTVWHQPDCGHCEEFLPRLNEIAARYSSCVPTALLDATQNEDLSDALSIEATPTVIVLRLGRTIKRFDRGLNATEREQLYASGGAACSR